MKRLILFFILTISSVSFATESSDFVEKCLARWGGPGIDFNEACKDISNQSALECANLIKAGYPDLIRACRFIQNNFNVSCMKAWNKPGIDIIKTCGEVSSEYSMKCIKSFNTGGVDSIRACGKVNNQFSSSCVDHWQDPNYITINSCINVNSQYSLDCVNSLKVGGADYIDACAQVKDQEGVDCIVKLDNKSISQISKCALISTQPKLSVDCYNCSEEAKTNNQKNSNDYSQRSLAQVESIREKLNVIENDKKFREIYPDFNKDRMNCMGSMAAKAMEDAMNSVKDNAAKKDLPVVFKPCNSLIEKYDDFLIGKFPKKSMFGWFN